MAHRQSKLYIDKRFFEEPLQIHTNDLATVTGHGSSGLWLNDNIIAFYLCLIGQRENPGGKIRVMIQSTFFFTTLRDKGYNMVRRWAKKKGAGGMDILKLDMMLIPICQNHHWTLAVINFKKQRIEYYDSLMSRKESARSYYEVSAHSPKRRSKLTHGQLLRNYLKSETLNQHDFSKWTDYWLPDAPKQHNGHDCGVFAIKMAEVVSRDGRISFSQDDMNLLRDRLLLEILDAKLLPSVSE